MKPVIDMKGSAIMAEREALLSRVNKQLMSL